MCAVELEALRAKGRILRGDKRGVSWIWGRKEDCDGEQQRSAMVKKRFG